MLSMPSRRSSAPAIGRLSLLAIDDTRHRSPDTPKVRRYRLARHAQVRPEPARPAAERTRP